MDDPDTGGWGRMVALSADFGALGRESVESLRVVLASLHAGSSRCRLRSPPGTLMAARGASAAVDLAALPT